MFLDFQEACRAAIENGENYEVVKRMAVKSSYLAVWYIQVAHKIICLFAGAHKHHEQEVLQQFYLAAANCKVTMMEEAARVARAGLAAGADPAQDETQSAVPADGEAGTASDEGPESEHAEEDAVVEAGAAMEPADAEAVEPADAEAVVAVDGVADSQDVD